MNRESVRKLHAHNWEGMAGLSHRPQSSVARTTERLRVVPRAARAVFLQQRLGRSYDDSRDPLSRARRLSREPGGFVREEDCAAVGGSHENVHPLRKGGWLRAEVDHDRHIPVRESEDSIVLGFPGEVTCAQIALAPKAKKGLIELESGVFVVLLGVPGECSPGRRLGEPRCFAVVEPEALMLP